MKRKNALRLFVLAIAFASWSMIRDPRMAAQTADVLVLVVNNSNSAAANLSLADARKMMLGETSEWRNGVRVLVVLKPSGNPDRDAVLKKVCGMTETIYTRYELQASFTGQTAASVNVASSDAAVKATVKANPGAVGFLHKSQVDSSIKAVLTLD
jgi:ABC-type phosphate transport system substrate-binding protein